MKEQQSTKVFLELKTLHASELETMNVTNHNNFGIRVQIINMDNNAFLVEDFGSSEDEGVEDVDRHH